MIPDVPNSLRAQLLALVGGVLVIVLVLLVAEGLADRDRELTRAREDTVTLTQLAIRDLETDLVAAQQLVIVLETLPAVRQPTDPACDTTLASLRDRYRSYAALGVALPDGRIVCASRPTPLGATVADRPWFRRAALGTTPSIGTYETGAISGQPVIALGRRITDPDGRFAGVVFASLPLDFFDRVAARTRLPEDTVLTIFDREGTVLARFPDARSFVGRRDPNAQLTRRVLRFEQGAAELQGLDGVERVYSFTTLQLDGQAALIASAGIERDRVYAQANASLRLHLAVVAMLALALLAFTLGAGQRLILRPIGALRDASRRLAAGDLAVRARLRGAPSEIDELGEAFDGMAESLQQRLEENIRLTRDLERRVDERTTQLRASNEVLEAFAHSVAHDLRSPLRTVHGFTSSVLRRNTALAPADRSDLERVTRTAERMDDLIRDLLALSRLTRAELPIVDLDLQQVLARALDDLREDITRSEATIEVVAPLGRALGNDAVVEQVFVNLVANALKFTRLGTPPHVRIETWHDATQVRVTVADQGIGMRPADHDRVFDAFVRLHSLGEYPGTGIGLAIVRQGIERLGGRVGVESKLGQGTRVWFTLPTRDADRPST